jgi:hypothetical protein
MAVQVRGCCCGIPFGCGALALLGLVTTLSVVLF